MGTAERTIERPRVERVRTRPDRRWMIVTAVAALLVGLIVGMLVWGAMNPDPTAIAAGGQDLTDRQQAMADVLDDYVIAWQAGDGEAAAALFGGNGVVEILGTELPVQDGVLASYINTNPEPELEILEPTLFTDTKAFNFHTISGFSDFANVFEFTTAGDVLIIRHVISG